MKICLFSPYFPNNFGGGEKYLLDVALAFANDSHNQVFLAIGGCRNLSQTQLNTIKYTYSQFINKSLAKIQFINTPLGTSKFSVAKLFWTKQFDVLFYLTDGSLFFSLARKNILHIQVPLKLDKSSFLERQKLKNWQTKITNSYFTKTVIEPTWETKINYVHQPMVEASDIIQATDFQSKQPIIINVGRFFPQLHSKRQDILVKIFAKLLRKYKKEMVGWKLVLIGSVEHEGYAQYVHQLAKGLPIEILHHVNRAELIQKLTHSSIYWHGTGYRVNEFDHPEKLEHFGITTVEAMAAGNVPVVLGKGGQVEVIGSGFADWSWLTQKDCIKKTVQLVRNPSLRLKLQQQAQLQSKQFSAELFIHKLNQMLA